MKSTPQVASMVMYDKPVPAGDKWCYSRTDTDGSVERFYFDTEQEAQDAFDKAWMDAALANFGMKP